MTDNPWPSIAWTAGLIAAFAYLIVVGQHISARRARQQAARRARINQRIAAERNPARRAAWRTIRDNNSEEGSW